jgi:methylenetetrahydrofolate--tRNA-(uracil-5-)-methyltransferase
MATNADLIVVGGGLAGCEAAWQAARRGLRVALYEMRPLKSTQAHTSGQLAEIVCSNSFGSDQRNKPAGLLKAELRHLNSFILRCAEDARLPAGGALAVDREVFSRTVTERLGNIPGVEIVLQEVTQIPQSPCIIASGPLTSPGLSDAIAQLLGHQFLFFYDAIAPIVEFDSIDMTKVFWASRYDNHEDSPGDYLNCPMTEKEYTRFITELINAKKVALRSFDAPADPAAAGKKKGYFEACLPVEVLAARDLQALSYGPLRPVGIFNPRDGSRPYAVLQLRQENLAKSLFNLVGFQTNLTYAEQDRVFRLVPGLENAVFTRYGQMHRNTYINSPGRLLPTMQYALRADLFFAGQITGVEGYTGNVASGLLAGINANLLLRGKEPLTLPRETMLGALMHYVANADAANFQPMKANFGLLPDLDRQIRSKHDKKYTFAKRALKTLDLFILEQQID